MAKILLVEDDNNLREIYEARLQAEGYTIISAHDGEEALVIAKAEKPDLVISDVMMPKISGFEMLDILRNTDGLQGLKVIMLTALGQSDDQQRANKLGADRYLVKSQVTLEDIVNVANELINSGKVATADATVPSIPGAPQATAPAASSLNVPTPAASATSTIAVEPTAVATEPAPTPSIQPTPAPQQDSAVSSTPTTTMPVAEPPASADPLPPPDNPSLKDMLSARDQAPLPEGLVAQTESQEEATVNSQINSFMAGQQTNSDETSTAKPASTTVAGMKVIQPLPSSEASKTDVNQFLQQPNSQVNSNPPAGTPVSPPSPGPTVIGPAPSPTPDAAADPENIAL